MRFSFGKNWLNFSKSLTNEQIEQAQTALASKLGTNQLSGKKFLDIGSGSGLMSLVAQRMGAEVFSFDYDVDSVECTRQIKSKYAPTADHWVIKQGSILDSAFLDSLGKFDVVYSWGVLHHTGNMMNAFENISALVKPTGILFISIYNDQGGTSLRWKKIKEIYNKGNAVVRFVLVGFIGSFFLTRTILFNILKFKNPLNIPSQERGMTYWYDLIDWVGGYPFEVAKPEGVFDFFHARNFELIQLRTVGGGLGCNEFVFRKK